MHRKDTHVPFATVGMLLLATLLIAACTGAPPAGGEPAEPTPTNQPPGGGPVEPTLTSRPPATQAPAPITAEPQAQSAVKTAQEELTRHTGLPVSGIAVLSVEAVTWPDTSLGCPKPDMMYAQVITPGYQVLLEASGHQYEVHTDVGQIAVVCEEEASAMEVTPEPDAVDAGLSSLIKIATEDLAQRLSVPADQIEVLEARAVVWPDSSLGCPQPGMRYRQVPMDGALIRLSSGGQVYEYHSGAGRDPFLCEQPLDLQKEIPTPIDLLKLTPGSP